VGYPWDSATDDVLVRMKHQFQRCGEQNGRAKLTTEKVIAIREAVRQRDFFLAQAAKLKQESLKMFEAARLLKNSAIAKRYGVSEIALKNVVYGANWKHVRLPDPGTVRKHRLEL
jgi:hypothetical protein